MYTQIHYFIFIQRSLFTCTCIHKHLNKCTCLYMLYWLVEKMTTAVFYIRYFGWFSCSHMLMHICVHRHTHTHTHTHIAYIYICKTDCQVLELPSNKLVRHLQAKHFTNIYRIKRHFRWVRIHLLLFTWVFVIHIYLRLLSTYSFSIYLSI